MLDKVYFECMSLFSIWFIYVPIPPQSQWSEYGEGPLEGPALILMGRSEKNVCESEGDKIKCDKEH